MEDDSSDEILNELETLRTEVSDIEVELRNEAPPPLTEQQKWSAVMRALGLRSLLQKILQRQDELEEKMLRLQENLDNQENQRKIDLDQLPFRQKDNFRRFISRITARLGEKKCESCKEQEVQDTISITVEHFLCRTQSFSAKVKKDEKLSRLNPVVIDRLGFIPRNYKAFDDEDRVIFLKRESTFADLNIKDGDIIFTN